MGKVKATHTIVFIPKDEVPQDRQVTYANFRLDHRPLKPEPMRVRLTIGGDKLDYPYDSTSPASSLLESKTLINSTISQHKKSARFISSDLKDFFLKTPMKRPEYMRCHWRHFPESIRKAYNLKNLKSDDNYIYCKIIRGMYGLKQAARLAYDLLKIRLAKHGYRPCRNNINIWTHETRPTKFCLCVDDFGIQYFSKADANHLLNALQEHYSVSTDWEGQHFCGLTLDWNYKDGWVDISMPGYIARVLHKFQHKPPHRPQHAPHTWTSPVYGRKRQYALPDDKDPIVPKEKIKFVQKVVGSLLFYARAIENTMLPALNEISHKQSQPTNTTVKNATGSLIMLPHILMAKFVIMHLKWYYMLTQMRLTLYYPKHAAV